MQLSRQETTALRGLAIALIILHNFTHWLPRCVPENEYTWALSRIQMYVHYITNGGPHLVLNFFSHYGHYGVALFLFLSGYGLVKKYEREAPTQRTLMQEVVDGVGFLLHHALKLWTLMLPALAVLWAMKTYMGGVWKWSASDVWGLVGFVANLGQRHQVIMGPWWWFSLMMQFYVIYRFVFYRRGKAVLLGFTGLCLIVQLVATGMSLDALVGRPNLIYHMHYNFPCSILPFALGIWAARYGAEWLLRPWTAVAALLVVVGGSYTPWLWAVAGPFAVAVMLQGRRLPLHWLGVISAWVFALHPIVREYTIGWARAGYLYTALLAYLAITLIAAWVATWLVNRIHKLNV